MRLGFGRRPVTALVLGGGAARGLAHVGALRALERHHIPIDLIVGTSMGAVIGALYLTSPSLAELEERIPSLLASKEFKRLGFSLMRDSAAPSRGGMVASMANLLRRTYVYSKSLGSPSFVAAQTYAAWIALLLPGVSFADLPKRLAVIATDLTKETEIVLTSGSLRRAVVASSALPGILPAESWRDGRFLVDGGWVDPLPVQPAYRLGAEVVIAVDVSERHSVGGDLGSGMEILSRANDVLRTLTARREGLKADVLIAPEVHHLHWADFDNPRDVIGLGDDAVEAGIRRIRAILGRPRWARSLGRGWRPAAASDFPMEVW